MDLPGAVVLVLLTLAVVSPASPLVLVVSVCIIIYNCKDTCHGIHCMAGGTLQCVHNKSTSCVGGFGDELLLLVSSFCFCSPSLVSVSPSPPPPAVTISLFFSSFLSSLITRASSLILENSAAGKRETN